MPKRPEKTVSVRPDSKGRITLGKLAAGVTSFRVSREDDGRIVLEPFTEIPAREHWLFENRKALASVRKGLQESAAGKAKAGRSFAKYADEPLD
jgi:hypothetical protein